MRRGERAKMGATAEVFGTGAAAGSNSDSSLQNTDGDLEACRRTDSNAEAPEAGCGTPLRLYMLPISPEGSALKPPREVVSVPPCPEGMARQGGKCVKATTGPVCGEESPGACEAPCQKGDGLACGVYGLAQARGEGGLAKDSAAAAANLSRGCELGSGNACYYTGILYREGQGVTKDLGRSVQLSERGCALGNGHACYEAGLSYEKGEGVTANGGRAFSYYEQGCAAGDANACNNVGTFYSKGTQGVQADPAKAAGLYRRACEAGSKTGCFNVALDYAQGNGVAQDDAKSVQYGTRACQLGHARSCYIVGGMKKDQALIQRACKLGYADACTP
jgi:TPR repeat protein